MKEPKRINIEGDHVTVEWGCTKLGRLGGAYKAGDYLRGKIRVSHGMTLRSKQAVLLHEELHDLWKRAGLDVTVPERYEEIVIDGLASWLLVFIRQNPDVLRFLQQEEM